MRAPRRLIRAIPLLLVCSIAGASAVWVPIACGCVDAWQTVAWGIGRKDIRDPAQITAQVIADGLAKTHEGKVVSARDLPFTTSTYDCAASISPTRTVRCRWWLWESDSGKKGFDVMVETSSDGVFQRVTVVPITYNDPMAV